MPGSSAASAPPYYWSVPWIYSIANTAENPCDRPSDVLVIRTSAADVLGPVIFHFQRPDVAATPSAMVSNVDPPLRESSM